MKNLFLLAGILGLVLLIFEYISMNNVMAIYLINRQVDINNPPQDVHNYLIWSRAAIDITLIVTCFLFVKFFKCRCQPTPPTTDF